MIEINIFFYDFCILLFVIVINFMIEKNIL